MHSHATVLERFPPQKLGRLIKTQIKPQNLMCSHWCGDLLLGHTPILDFPEPSRIGSFHEITIKILVFVLEGFLIDSSIFWKMHIYVLS
jgi:hypothetical protein